MDTSVSSTDARNKPSNRIATLIVAFLAIFALAAGGSFYALGHMGDGHGADAGGQSAGEQAQSSAPTVLDSSPAERESVREEGEATQEELQSDNRGSTAAVNLPEGAYPLAGGPMPSDTITKRNMTVMSPSGNLACTWGDSPAREGESYCFRLGGNVDSECYSPIEDAMFPTGSRFFSVDVQGIMHDDSYYCPTELPFYPDSGMDTLEYGQVAGFGDFACASEENGFTCWRPSTGHGVFFNHETVQQF